MPLEDRLTTPSEIDEYVASMLRHLGVDPQSARILKLTIPTRFVPEVRECHINAWLQMKYEQSGTVTSGWLVWQHRPSMTVEAHFHSVWKSAAGDFYDVTPREDQEATVLFAPDPTRSIRLTDYQGSPAIMTYSHVTMVDGQVRQPSRNAMGVIITELIYEHGLAVRPTRPLENRLAIAGCFAGVKPSANLSS